MQTQTLKRIKFKQNWSQNNDKSDNSHWKKSSRKINIGLNSSVSRTSVRTSTRTETLAFTRISTRPSTGVFTERNKNKKTHKRTQSDNLHHKRNFVVNQDLLLEFNEQKQYQEKHQKCIETSRFSQPFEQTLPEAFLYRPKKQIVKNNENILSKRFLKEDIFKLHNLFTGGYNCDDDFLSLTKFNDSKQKFTSLKKLYQNAEKQMNRNSFVKSTKKRDIFSVVFLNRNIKSLGQKESNQILHSLKMAR